MDAETILMIKVVATDAIKILGPAIIAAYATYIASKSQFEAKLKELDKLNEFQAREKLFDTYKERGQKLEKDLEKLSGSLGEILGLSAALEDQNNHSCESLVRSYTDLIFLFSKVTPLEISMTMRDMENYQLAKTTEYSELSAQNFKIKKLDIVNNHEKLKDNIVTLLEIYYILHMCNQKILQEQINKTFSKYVTPSN